MKKKRIVPMVACVRCGGTGEVEIKPSRQALHKHRQAAAAACAAGGPAPPRPSRRRVPCPACSGDGLQAGPPPVPLGDEPPTVAIIGGGIGGAALALALQQRGVAVRVYERDRSFAQRAQGYGLTMQQGANALSELGVPNEGVFSTAHHSFLPDGQLIGSYGRAVHASTKGVAGNGRGDRQRRNAHIPRQVRQLTPSHSISRHLAPSHAISRHLAPAERMAIYGRRCATR